MIVKLIKYHKKKMERLLCSYTAIVEAAIPKSYPAF